MGLEKLHEKRSCSKARSSYLILHLISTAHLIKTHVKPPSKQTKIKILFNLQFKRKARALTPVKICQQISKAVKNLKQFQNYLHTHTYLHT